MQRSIFHDILIEPVSLSKQLMTVKVTMKKGAVIPEHCHPNEQTSYIVTGSLCYVIAGHEVILTKGEGITIEANVPHSCTVLEDATDINTFYPPRKDYQHIFRRIENEPYRHYHL